MGGNAANRYRVEWTGNHELKPIRETANEPAVEYLAAVTGDESAAQKRGIEAGGLARRNKSIAGVGAPGVDPPPANLRPTRHRDITILERALTPVVNFQRALLHAQIP